MRRLLLSIAVLGASAGLAGTASAAPHAAALPGVGLPGHVQTVQYYDPDWRARRYWEHRRHEEWRRREAWRHENWRARHFYGAPPPYVWGGRPY